MNILHINKFHYIKGGADAAYFNTAKILEEHGYNSIFFSMHHPQNVPCETKKFFISYVDLVNSNGFMSQLKSAGRILYSLEAKKKLSQLLDKYPVDIAHLHNIHHQISPSILHILRKRKIPVIMTLHDYKMVCASYSMLANGKPCESCSGGKYYHAIKKRCVKRSFSKSALATLEMYFHHKILDIYDNVNIFISPSLFLKNKLQEMGFKKKIIYLPNFVNTEQLKQIPENGKVENKISVVYFGVISSIKGLWILIEVAKILKNKTDVTFKIIGDGPLKVSLAHIVGSLQLKNIRFLGYMKGEALFKEIKNSLFAILPSEWYENNPISVLEAFALGKPVIGSRIGGIPELVKDNETGLTFEPGNAEDLKNKIEYMLENRNEVIKMGINARELVEKEFSMGKYYKRLMEIYNKVIEKYH